MFNVEQIEKSTEVYQAFSSNYFSISQHFDLADHGSISIYTVLITLIKKWCFYTI